MIHEKAEYKMIPSRERSHIPLMENDTSSSHLEDPPSWYVVSNPYLQTIKRPFGTGPTIPVRGLTISMAIKRLLVLG